jgi:outer membrane lipoprotein-sorting protein
MKRIFLSVIVLFFALMAGAQTDAKAKQILDEMSAKMSSFKTISAVFAFSLENKDMGIYEENEGTIRLKGQKYAVDLPDVGIKVFSDGETVWNYMEDGNQVTITNNDDSENELMDPRTLFTIYEKGGFKPKFTGEKNIGSEKVSQIELLPETNQYEVSKIVLYVGKEDKMIKSALMYGTDKNIYGIKVKNIDTVTDYPDNTYVFNPGEYGDVEIIDFR